jgi:hypothetical protein
LTQAPYSYANGDPLDQVDPLGLCGHWYDVACQVGSGATWAYHHPATVGVVLGGAALAATGVGVIADAGIAAGVGAGEGLAAGAAEVTGAAAVTSEAAVSSSGWTTAAGLLNGSSFAVGGYGAGKTCYDEGFSNNCKAGIAFGIGGVVTGIAGLKAGDLPWLFWGNNALGLGYNVAGERDFNCGGWHLA